MIRSLEDCYQLLIRFLRPHRRQLLLLALLLVGGTGLQAAVPLAIRAFIDAVVAQGEVSRLYFLAFLFLAGGLVAQILPAFTTYVGEDIAWRATNRLRSALTGHVLRLDMSFHNSHAPGELIERIDGDVIKLANFLSAFVVRLLGSLLWALGIVTVLSFVDWRMGLTLGLFVVVYLVTSWTVYRRAAPGWRAESECRAEIYGYLGDRLAGIRDIRTSGAVDYVVRKFDGVIADFLRSVIKAHNAEALGGYTGNIVWFLAYASALILGIHLFKNDEITIGTVYLILHYISSIRGPMGRIAKEIEDLQRVKASVGRVRELFETRPTVGTDGTTSLPEGSLTVDVERVSFFYHPGNWVLEDLTLEIGAGRVVGLLGRTGSGKTTLSRLLCRLYDPIEGTIRIGGKVLREVHAADLRRKVGIATQDVQLFQGTVRDNLTLFDPHVGDDLVLAGIRRLGLELWYDALPDGLDTRLATDGGLSAGEAQLVSFVRVFLKDPGLVILDEATSRIDPATERLIEQAVQRLLSDRTAIIIAHRLTTVQRVDDIMIMADGRIEEYGPRQALQADGRSRFSQLLKTGLEEALE